MATKKLDVNLNLETSAKIAEVQDLVKMFIQDIVFVISQKE